MKAAEIVFTTLSSTGNRLVKERSGFDLVLIDEATQATEVATLQPLSCIKDKYASSPPVHTVVMVSSRDHIPPAPHC